MADNLVIGGATFTGVTGIKATDTNDNVLTFKNGIDVDDILSGSAPSGAVVADSVTTVPAYAGAGLIGITSLTSNSITVIRELGFAYCVNLEEVVLTALTTLRNTTGGSSNAGDYFYNCKKISRFYAPALTTVYNQNALQVSGAAGGVYVLPALTTITARMFKGCGKITVDFGANASAMGADTFFQGTSGKTAILRNTTLVTVSNTDALATLSTIYVPQALISSYQTATNWVTKYNAGTLTINAIEGSAYEHNYADGTPIPTT